MRLMALLFDPPRRAPHHHQEAKKNTLGLNFDNITIEAFALMINARKGFFTINLQPQVIHFFHKSPINLFQLFL
jgi:hypothetical protein